MSKIDCTDKKIYSEPLIEIIKLDVQICLSIESNPPAPETFNKLKSPDWIPIDPFQANIM